MSAIEHGDGRTLPPRPDTRPVARAALAARCRRGDEPAEALLAAGMRDTHDRLIRELWAAGWTDVEIAAHTRHTTYTVDRIRRRLDLTANDTRPRGVA